jgi:hypothetical protein
MENINANFKVMGDVEITLTSDGVVKETRTVKNLVVTTGKNWIVGRMMGTEATEMTHMAIGTGTTAQVIANTALQTQVARVAHTDVALNNYITYSATFPAGTGIGAITEAGIFNASSAGIMLCRTTFAAVNKDVLDTLSITWTLTVL